MLNFECSNTAEDTAYHEAGHVVSGMGLGCRPLQVYIRSDMTGGVEWLDSAEGQSIAQTRRQLIHCVAGPVAEFLYEADQLWYTRYRWADRLDPCDWESSYRLLSARIRRGETGDGDWCDTTTALFYGREVCRRLRLQDAGKWDERQVRNHWAFQHGRPSLFWCRGYPIGCPTEPNGDEESDGGKFELSGPVTPPEVSHDEIVAEVVRAERWAERLLRRRWAAVTAVAEALYHSPDGTLTGKDVCALVAAASEPAAACSSGRSS